MTKSSSLELVHLKTFDSNDRSLDSPANDSSARSGTKNRMAAVAVGGGSGVSRSRSATEGRQVCRQTPVTGAISPVAEAVDGEVETGVQVRQHGREQVNGQRQAVRAVVQQHDDVRGPAADERDEDDEDRFYLANRLHRCNVSSFGGALYKKQNMDKGQGKGGDLYSA